MKVLQYSGGMDSLACLILLQDEPDLVVVTLLTDGAYSETALHLNRVQERFDRIKFVTLFTDRQLPQYGRPVDVVPVRWTAMGALARGSDIVRYQDSMSCCHRAIWEPLDAFSRGTGATVIYRGQRNDDRLKAPVIDGYVDRGVTLRFPIADWDRQRVARFVRQNHEDLLPEYYLAGENSSRDCWDCTAYLQDNEQRITNLPADKYKVVSEALARWRRDVATEMEN